MRRLLFLFVLISISLQANAQNTKEYFRAFPGQNEINSLPEWAQMMYSEDPNAFQVMDAYENYYRENQFVKNTHTQNYKFWMKNTYDKLDEEGKIRAESSAERLKYLKELKFKRTTLQRNQSSTWDNIGPFETYFENSTTPVSWQANVYCLDQSINNPDLVICGTEHGGVFKSLDRGFNWSLASADALFCNSTSAVAIDPSNDNVFFAGGGGDLYKTTDGGNSWNLSIAIGGGIHEIKFDPDDSNHIFVVSNSGLHVTSNGGASWTQTYSQTCWDLEFHPTDTDTVYLLIDNPSLVKAEFYRSTDSGTSWSNMTSGWYVPEVSSEAVRHGGKIAVSANAPDRVYAALIGNSKAGDDGWIGVYRSNYSGDEWYLPSGQIGGPYNTCNTMPWNVAAYCNSTYHQGFYNFDFEVSPTDAELMWIGTIRLTESSDGAVSFSSIGGSGSVRLNDIHADIQSIHVSTNDIWVCSDGGINHSNNDLVSHTSRKNGVSASAYWGFDIGWNEDVMAGGRYHNGNAVLYQTYGLGNSHHMGGVEESTGHVNPLNNQLTYFGCCYGNGDGTGTTTYPRLIPKNLGDSRFDLPTMNFRPNEHYVPWSSSALYHHPNYADNIIAGKQTAIWQSLDGGKNWDVLYDFGAGYVTEIEYCRSNPDHIYALNRIGGSGSNTMIYKSTDAGVTWNAVTTPPTNAYRFTISVNPLDENEIWAAAPNGTDGAKVYKSTDGGSSWTNMTTSAIDGQQVFDMEYHANSNGLVYILTRDNFFYYDPIANDWVQYNTGLPLVLSSGEIKFIKLFYRDRKIKLASARGVWEVDFPFNYAPIADIITESATISCSDVVQFDSHSFVDQDNTTWSWNFTPMPAYVSDLTARNPIVLFDQGGNYDVSLTVTNGSNQAVTKTISQMVFVDGTTCNSCTNGYEKVGEATVDAANCCFELTQAVNWTNGGIWSGQKVNLTNSYEWSFELDMGSISGNDADGMAFVLQKAGYPYIGDAGGQLGCNDIEPSLAVTFRTWVHDQIEIWPNGGGIGSNISPVTPTISGSGIHPVTIRWNACTSLLSVDWNNDGADIEFIYNIGAGIFSGDPSEVIWGFTAANGGANAVHKVCNINMVETDYSIDYNLVGATTDNLGGCCFELTHGVINEEGGLWNNNKINLLDDFSLDFMLSPGGLEGPAGDGIAFVLQKQGLTALGSGASTTCGHLGTFGITPSLAVGFQTGIVDQIEIYPNGLGCDNNIANTTPAISGEGPFPVTINWKACDQILEIDWNADGVDLSFNYDIVGNIFSNDPTDVIWGFTAGSDNALATQRVCDIEMITQLSNDECICPMELAVDPSTCVSSTFTNDQATPSSGIPEIGCVQQLDPVDVWFSLVVPPSGNVIIETSPVSGGLTDILMQVFSGTCGNLIEIACDDNSGTGNHPKVVIYNQMPSDVLLFRIVDVNSDEIGEFDVCAYDFNCPSDFAGINKLTGALNMNADYEANGLIESDQIIDNNAIVDYDSGNQIDLLPGFEAKIGVLFNAFIDGCGNLFKQNDTEKE